MAGERAMIVEELVKLAHEDKQAFCALLCEYILPDFTESIATENKEDRAG